MKVWLSFFEATPIEWTQFQPYGADVRHRLKFIWRPKLSDLEAKRTMQDLKKSDYRAAWAWTCFLLQESQETRNLLLEYLEEIAKNHAPKPLSQWLAKRIPNTQQRWIAFVKTMK